MIVQGINSKVVAERKLTRAFTVNRVFVHSLYTILFNLILENILYKCTK